MTALTACLILAVYESWKLTLVIMILVPVMFVLSFWESKPDKPKDIENEKPEISELKTLLEDMDELNTQIVGSFKTITSFNLQNYFISKYYILLKSINEKNIVQARKKALSMAATKASLLFIFPITYFVGSYMISTGNLQYPEFLKITEGVMYLSFLFAEDSITSFGKYN